MAAAAAGDVQCDRAWRQQRSVIGEPGRRRHRGVLSAAPPLPPVRRRRAWLQRSTDMNNDDITRRGFVGIAAAGIAAAATGTVEAQQVVETNVEIKTPDGMCDAAFIHPATG